MVTAPRKVLASCLAVCSGGLYLAPAGRAANRLDSSPRLRPARMISAPALGAWERAVKSAVADWRSAPGAAALPAPLERLFPLNDAGTLAPESAASGFEALVGKMAEGSAALRDFNAFGAEEKRTALSVAVTVLEAGARRKVREAQQLHTDYLDEAGVNVLVERLISAKELEAFLDDKSRQELGEAAARAKALLDEREAEKVAYARGLMARLHRIHGWNFLQEKGGTFVFADMPEPVRAGALDAVLEYRLADAELMPEGPARRRLGRFLRIGLSNQSVRNALLPESHPELLAKAEKLEKGAAAPRSEVPLPEIFATLDETVAAMKNLSPYARAYLINDLINDRAESGSSWASLQQRCVQAQRSLKILARRIAGGGAAITVVGTWLVYQAAPVGTGAPDWRQFAATAWLALGSLLTYVFYSLIRVKADGLSAENAGIKSIADALRPYLE